MNADAFITDLQTAIATVGLPWEVRRLYNGDSDEVVGFVLQDMAPRGRKARGTFCDEDKKQALQFVKVKHIGEPLEMAGV